jgi:Tfp pilus assembly protein FimV
MITKLAVVSLIFITLLGAAAGAWLAARHQLEESNSANTDLRKALGEMAVALAQKDREIDRLRSANGCGATTAPTPKRQ